MTVVPLLAMTEILLIVLTSSTREGQVCHTTHHDYAALLEVSSRTDMAPKDVTKQRVQIGQLTVLHLQDRDAGLRHVGGDEGGKD